VTTASEVWLATAVSAPVVMPEVEAQPTQANDAIMENSKEEDRSVILRLLSLNMTLCNGNF